MARGWARLRAAALRLRPGSGAGLACVGAGSQRQGHQRVRPQGRLPPAPLHGFCLSQKRQGPLRLSIMGKRSNVRRNIEILLQEPPYEIQESGCASIEIPIHVYLKYSNRPKKIRLRYSLQIENNTKSNSESRCIYYDFENPPEELYKALMSGGGEMIARTGTHVAGKRLVVVLSDSDDRPRKTLRPRKYKFVEPIQCKHGPKKRTKYIYDEICSKCGESTTVDIRKQLRAVAMTEEEISRVSQLYLSYTSYEKSVDALELPPLSDSIYRLPEIPRSLRDALKTEDGDYQVL